MAEKDDELAPAKAKPPQKAAPAPAPAPPRAAGELPADDAAHQRALLEYARGRPDGEHWYVEGPGGRQVCLASRVSVMARAGHRVLGRRVDVDEQAARASAEHRAKHGKKKATPSAKTEESAS